jgi:hypothetical protein
MTAARVVAGLALAIGLGLALHLRVGLDTNGAQNDYPCVVAQQRASDPGLQDESAVEALLQNRLYVGGTRPNDPFAAWAAELRAGPVGTPVPRATLEHTVPTYVRPPPDHPALDDVYALVGVDDNPAHPGLGYIIAYGRHSGIDPVASTPVPAGAGIELIRRCSIRTVQGRTEVTVYAGSVASSYHLQIKKP